MSDWHVIVARAARKQLAALDPTVRQRVHECLRRLPEGDIRKLQGSEGIYRARVGDWRVLFELDHAARTISVSGIFRRDKAYR